MKRIELTDKASKLIEKQVLEFKKRKIPNQDWIKIFSEALLSVPQEFWAQQTELHTPDSYFVEQAMQDPRIQKEFIEFVRGKNQKTKNSEAEL